MAKTGRNDPCPCGSGKKYKKCCISKDKEPVFQPAYRNPHVSHWDDVIRWQAVVNGKTMTVVRQIPVVIDRETGEPFPEPYIALLKIDRRTTRVLTRTTKMEVCNYMCEQKRLDMQIS